MEEKLEILIVDDDPGHVELVKRNLKRTGVANKMIDLQTGQMAIDYVFCRGPYEGRTGNAHPLVLLDINMPGGVDGIEVLRQIKADPTKKKIPVIMLTTTDDTREVNRCYELGCSVYIKKPIGATAFIEAINRLGLFITVVTLPTKDGGGT